jgi:hypothetical protein
MTIEISKLREVISVLLDHLEEVHGGVVDLDADFFWNIPKESLYDPYQQPTELTLGQLTESWRNIESIRSDSDDVINYGLVWLADVLRAIGYQVPG